MNTLKGCYTPTRKPGFIIPHFRIYVRVDREENHVTLVSLEIWIGKVHYGSQEQGRYPKQSFQPEARPAGKNQTRIKFISNYRAGRRSPGASFHRFECRTTLQRH